MHYVNCPNYPYRFVVTLINPSAQFRSDINHSKVLDKVISEFRGRLVKRELEKPNGNLKFEYYEK